MEKVKEISIATPINKHKLGLDTLQTTFYIHNPDKRYKLFGIKSPRLFKDQAKFDFKTTLIPKAIK